MEAVRARKRAIVDSFSGGGERRLRRQEKLELVFGEASFRGPHLIEVRLSKGGALTF